MAENYVLHITAGSDYADDQQVQVPVNTAKPIHISSDLADIELNVRVQDYKGLPRESPTTSPYFAAEPHAYNQDQYSISFRFTPKKPAGDDGPGISGTNLQFGNDFEHPIRDRLPPGFSTAMGIVQWWIDPGLEGDAYADKPYLYGPALSSFNTIAVGPGEYDEEKGGIWVEEGGDEAGMKTRQELGVPDTNKARMKWALRPENKEKWVWEYGQTYGLDFYNPYLDFANLALKLPGFQLPIMKYWDGQNLRPDQRRSHQLRYVLRNKETDQTYMVVLFTLYPKELVNEDGSLKPEAKASLAAEATVTIENGEDEIDEVEALKQAEEILGPKPVQDGADTTTSDDVD